MGGLQGVPGQCDPHPHTPADLVDVCFEPQYLEQAPCQRLGELVEVTAADRQQVEQCGVGLLHLHCPHRFEVLGELGSLGAEFLTATPDIGDQLRVDRVGHLPGPRQSRRDRR
ncbi:hypothetical protein [Pseudonocardia sp. NPDC046786]|uniref:hypothetical protein n=1 Tax=Pseudonocardia sp. NPDC046786 TaxID=3155471 RepID=UPI0033D6873A